MASIWLLADRLLLPVDFKFGFNNKSRSPLIYSHSRIDQVCESKLKKMTVDLRKLNLYGQLLFIGEQNISHTVYRTYHTLS
jgi:hypothetical protein